MDNETLPPLPIVFDHLPEVTRNAIQETVAAARADLAVEIERWKEIVESLRHVSSQLAQRDERIGELEEQTGSKPNKWRISWYRTWKDSEERAEAAEGAAHAAISHRERTEGELAQRDAEIERLKAEKDNDYRRYCEEDEIWRRKTEAAEAEVLRLRTGFQTATVDLVAAELRIKDLEQSAEVAARRMRDLVAEHVRERDALQARIKELEQWA